MLLNLVIVCLYFPDRNRSSEVFWGYNIAHYFMLLFSSPVQYDQLQHDLWKNQANQPMQKKPNKHNSTNKIPHFPEGGPK